MNHQDLINTCIFEQIQGLLFSDLSGPLIYFFENLQQINKIQLYSFYYNRQDLYYYFAKSIQSFISLIKNSWKHINIPYLFIIRR